MLRTNLTRSPAAFYFPKSWPRCFSPFESFLLFAGQFWNFLRSEGDEAKSFFCLKFLELSMLSIDLCPLPTYFFSWNRHRRFVWNADRGRFRDLEWILAKLRGQFAFFFSSRGLRLGWTLSGRGVKVTSLVKDVNLFFDSLVTEELSGPVFPIWSFSSGQWKAQIANIAPFFAWNCGASRRIGRSRNLAYLPEFRVSNPNYRSNPSRIPEIIL